MPRRRRGAIERLALAKTLAVLVLLSGAQQAWSDPESDLPADGAGALEDFLARVHTLTAQFEQELWTADEELVETATGSLSLKRPNRFLWSYRTPIEQRIVADGERLWMYDVELAQVTVTPLDAPAASSPAMLLSGDQAVREGFDLRESFVLGGISWVRLAPKLEGTDFSSILIGFRGRDLARLELVDGLDQVTRIAFSNVMFNIELDDELFDFEPPDGVDVIGSD